MISHVSSNYTIDSTLTLTLILTFTSNHGHRNATTKLTDLLLFSLFSVLLLVLFLPLLNMIPRTLPSFQCPDTWIPVPTHGESRVRHDPTSGPFQKQVSDRRHSATGSSSTYRKSSRSGDLPPLFLFSYIPLTEPLSMCDGQER